MADGRVPGREGAGRAPSPLRDETDRDAYRSRRWSMIGPSDVELSWSSDTAAVRAQVSIDRRSRDLIGTVRTINHPNQGTARIRLARKAC